ncbi:MAG: Transcriptional regulatory protein sin3 [Claussenomyces sp. TS43310]|nr:MAG: Transcriptional regulatory protein sin3 [Claussenomyces sp. TS43310]
MNNPAQSLLSLDRDREREREREIEEQRTRERQHLLRQQDEIAQRERDHNERERQLREQQYSVPQHQNNTGAIPIHQPVASRLPGAIHSPGGLLANHGGAPAPNPLGAPNGPGNAFGGPLHSDASRSIQQQNQHNAAAQQQQHQMFGQNMLNHSTQASAPLGVPAGSGPNFGGPLQAEAAARSIQQIPFGPAMGGGHPAAGAPALGQGQQPILNDALSYLDQVKVQFVDQPDVYNRFLDIMKDFKSQAIDTPGVINRVSELFAGHPNLIQGFNTFLPPGYRIECGAGNDPNTIRVTTPMGTTVQSISGSGRAALPDGPPIANHGPYYNGPRSTGWQQQPQHPADSPEAVFSPQPRNGIPPFGQGQGPNTSYESQQAAAAHQQEQRGVHQLTNAAASAAGQVPRNTMTPTPAQSAPNGIQQPGMEKRGPVEFNHAISYVNKIKNRFQDKPEIYKQFLEILQTYQRESKPIQDVYAQVTSLFSEATDLLEDFKQFLPESAAQAKAAAKAAEDSAAMNLAGVSQTPQVAHTSRVEKLPVVGNFAPPSTGKETKKRVRAPVPAATPMASVTETSNVRGATQQGGNVAKRQKPNNHRSNDADISPTLMPNIPEPMAPASSNAVDPRDIAFFDKVKKFISNKQVMAEFLKLCNLFTQDLIDKNVLVHKVSNFIGSNAELMDQFKTLVRYSAPEEVLENRPKPPSGKVSLSNCRGLGPSYRLLPKRERLRACSGRDEMCYSVLNDDWASHPTWASEDSGFVAHRKNIFEESLHRIEEERHDYDFNIEANAKVIQLLEPIGQQILGLNPSELAQFRMPMGLGGQSQSIYKRVFKKIYGPERGLEVAADIFRDPISVLPVVLARLKQKDEEWRFTQREWEKVWHAQTTAMYRKSLDHMGIHVKQADRKLTGPKHIVEQIKSVYEGQRRQRSLQGKAPRHQYSYDFRDDEVVLDAIRLAILYVNTASQHSVQESDRISNFFENFAQTFFGIPSHIVEERIKDVQRDSEDDGDDVPPAELSNGRGRRANGKKDLRRGVLDKPRNGNLGRTLKEDSIASGSKESTPDIGSGMDDADDQLDAQGERGAREVTNERWLSKNPSPTAVEGTKPLDREDIEMQADHPFKREWYSMYCNQTLFIFFTIFELLYRRLKAMKDSEADVTDEVRRNKARKPAKEIGLIEEKAEIFNHDGTSSYYAQTLLYIEAFIEGQHEEAAYQDFLRHFYLKKGWALYTIHDTLKSLCRNAGYCAGNDSRDKTSDIYQNFEKNRGIDETTYNTEINYRKSVEKFIKDGEMYLIRYTPRSHHATAQILFKDQTTFELSEMERRSRWQYYVSSFVRIEPTEGVPRRRLQRSVLPRNLPSSGETESVSSSSDSGIYSVRKGLKWMEGLVIRICVNTYRMAFKQGTSEWFIYTDGSKQDAEQLAKRKETRDEGFAAKCERNVRWMENLTHEQVQKVNDEFSHWMQDGVLPGRAA